MKKSFLLFVLSFWFGLSALAQSLSGVILDQETKKPIHHVAIYLPKLGLGTTTLRNGEFSFSTDKKFENSDIIEFSILGYKTKRISIEQFNNQGNKTFLERIYENLDEVVINSKVKKKASIPFKKLADLPQRVGDASSVLFEDKIYLISGDKSYLEETNRRIMEESISFQQFLQRMQMDVSIERYNDRLQIYDITNDRWELSDQKFSKRAFHKVVQANNNIYSIGGKKLNVKRTRELLDNSIEVYSPKSNVIEVDKTNPHQAVNFAALSYQDNIILMGGSVKKKKSGAKVYSNKSYVFNTKTGLWYNLPPMVTPKETNGVLLKDKIYLFGGFRDNPLTQIESFDLNSGKWTLEGDLFKGIANPALAASVDEIFIYNPGKLTVFNNKTRALTEYNLNLFMEGAQIQYFNNQLYIFSGFLIDKLAYSKRATKELYVIDLSGLPLTKINKSKAL